MVKCWNIVLFILYIVYNIAPSFPLLTFAGTDMMGKMLKMQMLEDEDDLAYETEKKQRASSASDAQPAWMRTLHTTACNWLQLIPQTVSPLKRTVENIKVMAEMRANVVDKQTRCKIEWTLPKLQGRQDTYLGISIILSVLKHNLNFRRYIVTACHRVAHAQFDLLSLLHKLAHQDPLFRFFEREVKMGGKMLQEVRQDLSDVVQVCEGKRKQTNDLRTLISDLVKGKIPHLHLLNEWTTNPFVIR